MKEIKAIISPFKVDEVKRALNEAGIEGITVSDVRGCGQRNGHAEMSPGDLGTTDLVAKVKLEIVVPSKKVTIAIRAIVSAVKTGKVGDGKIFVSPIDEVIRIRTGEKGNSAI